MRRWKSLIAVVAATSAVVLVGSAAPVVSQPPAERQTITLFDPRSTEFDRFLNEGKKGISPGDTILFIEKQLDPDTCEKAGQVIGRIQIIKPVGRENAIFSGGFTVTLDGGKITAAGAARFSEFESGEPAFAVTGGTETYKDASGEVSFGEDRVDLCGTRGDLITIDVGPAK